MAEQLRLVVLDRDGVINHDSDEYIKSPDEWRPIEGSLDAIAALHAAGYAPVVATNQSGIARGLYHADTLDAIHEKMLSAVRAAGGELHGVFVCPHGPNDGCDCRKPLPGLLRQIEDRFETSLRGRPYIGDKIADIEAAAAVGARPILVRTGYGRDTEKSLPEDHDVEIFDDLAAAARFLIDRGC